MGRESRARRNDVRIDRPGLVSQAGPLLVSEAAALERQKERLVYLAFPSGGSPLIAFFSAVMNAVLHDSSKPLRDRCILQVGHSVGLYIGENRRIIASKFMESRASWLLMIDDDLGFPPELPEALVAIAQDTGSKILAVNVPLGHQPTSLYRIHPETPWLWQPIWPLPTELTFPVDGAATAVMLVHRSVFEAVPPEVAFRYGWNPEDGSFIGEDLGFCRRARAAGFGILGVRLPGIKHYKVRPLEDDCRDLAKKFGAQAASEESPAPATPEAAEGGAGE